MLINTERCSYLDCFVVSTFDFP